MKQNILIGSAVCGIVIEYINETPCSGGGTKNAVVSCRIRDEPTYNGGIKSFRIELTTTVCQRLAVARCGCLTIVYRRYIYIGHVKLIPESE
jgi:hypothetical protein